MSDEQYPSGPVAGPAPAANSAPAPETNPGTAPEAGPAPDEVVARTPAALPGEPVTALAASLSDGEWHRLHPASPLLKGGIALLAIIGVIIANLRERLIEMFVPQAGYGAGDPIDLILESGYLLPAIGAVLAVLVVLVIGFYVSWRMHTFRITDEVVEVRSGVLFRTNRRARLDRIQGINIVRPVIARLFGAAKLEVNQAGQDANVKLEYLGSGAADDLRREILRLASGSRAVAQHGAAATTAEGSIVDRRLGEFLAPELDPNAAEPESVVKLSVGRLLGSIALSGGTIFLVLMIVAVIVTSIFASEALFGLIGVIPAALGIGTFYVQRFLKSLRYTIAGTPDGVRVGFGLLTTSNETLPPGRIHSVKVSQPILWRTTGWWEVKVNRAGHSSASGAAGQQNTTILPVGNLDDVRRVLGLVLPEFSAEEALAMAETGMIGRGTDDDGFANSPRRARVLRWFSWRRNGFAVGPGSVLLRKGKIWRELVIVPHPRLQSIALSQGPLQRRLSLAAVYLHTVAGPITAQLGAIDADTATAFFDDVAAAAVSASSTDTSHRWRSTEDA
ncbi:PH domain-containing protein [Marisediminicola senii]|uniref:PH domain-containing protein n=1 Tax=Marisediminicola senii TaxID=2711233 RepID=UPI0013EAAC75|nr:PH domain-containing protein [Marisediminicola senii]